jgi:hypothetical protein
MAHPAPSRLEYAEVFESIPSSADGGARSSAVRSANAGPRRRARRAPEGYISVAALAAVAPISRSAIYRALRRQELRGFRWRGKIVVSQADVDVFFTPCPLATAADGPVGSNPGKL